MRKLTRKLLTVFAIGSMGALSAQLSNPIHLVPLSSYSTGIFDEGAAEIADYDATTQRIFFTNADANTVEALDASDPSALALAFSIDMSVYGGGVNSVVVLNGGIAVAVEANVKQDPGSVVFFDLDGNFLSQVTAGALPDMVTVTPDGTKVVVANEGEPSDDYTVDPEGSVSIIDISGGLAGLTAANVSTADFSGIMMSDIPGVRIFGPGASIAQDLEPEYVAVSADSQTAFVACQENNALAIVDIPSATVTDIVALGTKDHSLPGNELDASNQDAGINIRNWPIKGLYLPDAIDLYTVGGNDYIVTANEGDSRDYDGFSEEERGDDLVLDSVTFPGRDTLQLNENLGRIKVTTTLGDTDNDGDYDEIYTYGARSFSIWDAAGNLVFDSGSEFERIIAQQTPDVFNSNNDDNDSFESRSDDKGPEPEAVEIAQIGGISYAFIGLERIGGIMVYDVTDPMAPQFIEYVNNRDFSQPVDSITALDSGVESLRFIPAADSPNGKNLIISSNEVSGTVTAFEIVIPDYTLQILHASDLEGGVDAIGRASIFASIVDDLEEDYENSITLSAGDNYIPGPFFNAAGDFALRATLQDVYQDLFNEPGLTNIREGSGRADIAITNIIGLDASAIGNHEFDATPNTFEGLIATDIRGAGLGDVRWLGAQYPYLSSNLDFSAEGDLVGLFTSDILPNTDFQSLPSDLTAAGDAPKIAPSTIITRGGEQIGVVGATTQIVESITSTGDVSEVTGGANDMAALAAVLQPEIDALVGLGINKIVVVSHLQQLALETALSALLTDVDVIIAGGSDAILANPGDRLFGGSTADAEYPIVTTDFDGNPTLIVSTDGEYSYVGRLVVGFDASGNVIPAFTDEGISGPYICDETMLGNLYGSDDPFALNSKGELVSRLTGAVEGVVIAKDGNILGRSSVYLDGVRSSVRTEETNLGNLTADANLWVAQQYDGDVQVSLKNGGGIRAAIGEVVEVSEGVFEFLPPQANPLSGKQNQEVSQLDVENTLRFNNGLSLLTLSAADLKAVMEHAFAATVPGATPGQFPQVGGMKVAFDSTQAEGSKVADLWIVDGDGEITDVIVENGELYGDTARQIRIVTLDFLAGGGDSYPYPALAENRVDLEDVLTEVGTFDFAAAGTEQDAIAEYLNTFHDVDAFSEAETPVEEDERIQQLAFRGNGLGLCEEDLFAEAPKNPATFFIGSGDALKAAPTWDPYFGATECQIRAGRVDMETMQFVNPNNLVFLRVRDELVGLPISNLGYGVPLIDNPRFNIQPGETYGWQVRCECFDEVSPWSDLTENTIITIPEISLRSSRVADAEFGIFPNPVDGGTSIVTLTPFTSEEGAGNLQILDMQGRVVFSQQVLPGEVRVELNTSSMQSGMYLIDIRGGSRQHTDRLIVR